MIIKNLINLNFYIILIQHWSKLISMNSEENFKDNKKIGTPKPL